MKKITALFLVVIMLFALAACGEEDPTGAPAGMKLASNPEIVDYSLFVPEDWIVTSATGMTMAQASLLDASNVIVTHHSATEVRPYTDTKKTLNEYFYGLEHTDVTEYTDELLNSDGYLSRLVDMFDKTTDENGNEVSTFAFVTTPTYTTVKKGDKEVAAMKLMYTAMLDGAEVQQIMLLAYEDAYFFNITCTCTPGIYADLADTFDLILKNFTFED